MPSLYHGWCHSVRLYFTTYPSSPARARGFGLTISGYFRLSVRVRALPRYDVCLQLPAAVRCYSLRRWLDGSLSSFLVVKVTFQPTPPPAVTLQPHVREIPPTWFTTPIPLSPPPPPPPRVVPRFAAHAHRAYTRRLLLLRRFVARTRRTCVAATTYTTRRHLLVTWPATAALACRHFAAA